MKKLVNGKVVDIKNIDLFELAAEGAAIDRTLPNIIPRDKLDLDFEIVDEMISIYRNFYNILPFPLYSIDTNIKYCAAGLVIMRETRVKNKMWVDEGLFICIDEETKLCLGFVNKSWGIVKFDELKNTGLDLSQYKGDVGYEEFVWVIASLFKKSGTEDYYKVFMSNFVEACGNQAIVMRWELSNILQFGNTPERLNLPDDKIVDLVTKTTYSLDIFVAGTRNTKSQEQVWGINSDTVASQTKKVNVYGYDLYMKPAVRDGAIIRAGDDKMKQVELFGINSLFCTLCSIKSNDSSDTFSSYKGFIADNNFVYLIDSRLFVAKSRNYVDAKEIARGVEIYSYSDGIVYIIKPKILKAGIRKENIYSYNLQDGNLRLCKIQFARI